MYEERFDPDWDTLSQEEAMFRAYALGVDAAFGVDHPEKLERLGREFHRGLIQIAYDEGKSRASDVLREREHDPETAGGVEFEPSEYDWEVWDELVTDRRSDPEAFELVRVSEVRDDLPSSLRRPSMLDPPSTGRPDSLRLPRFLLR